MSKQNKQIARHYFEGLDAGVSTAARAARSAWLGRVLKTIA